MKTSQINVSSRLNAGLVGAAMLVLVSCGAEVNWCDQICEWESECFSVCDYPEEPGCDPVERAQIILNDCLDKCNDVALEGSECADATGPWAACLDVTVCEATLTDQCRIDETRYYEMCYSGSGDWVCGYFCEHLATGCISWETFGYRGTDCEETCRQGALDSTCREAHYNYYQCVGPTAFACELETDECDDEAAALNAACEAWQPASPIPAEIDACATIAQHQCDCDFHTAENNCVELAANRCRFEYGRGQACIDAINAFDLCMISIPDCEREVLAVQCLTEWNAWSDACMC